MSSHDQQSIDARLRTVADPVRFLIDLFTLAPVGVAVWRADGQLLLTNPAFVDIFQVQPPPDYNLLKDELFVESGVRPLLERAFRGETVRVPMFIYGPSPRQLSAAGGGRRIAISMTLFPLLTKRGEVQYVAATYKDETELASSRELLALNESRIRDEALERGRAEVALRATEDQLRQSQKMEAVGSLAGSIAHDFSNILSVVLGYTETLLADLKPDDPLRADVQEIAAAGGRGRDLTRQLLAFSRQQVLEPKLVDLNEVFSGMTQMLARLVGEHIELAFVPGRDLGAVRVDPSQIEQVLLNLVVNARDAMPSGGKLTVATSSVVLDQDYADSHFGIEPGPYVLLSVSDSGVGMDAATRARIFEPFFTTKEKGKGTGLGLSTVFGIIRQSGGTIWVDSQPGEGTTFKVYLPRVDATPVVVSPATSSAASSRGSETVLLAEDDPQLRALVSTTLRRNGYRVLEAGNGNEALALAERYGGGIDILLSDVVMPGMGGRQLWERLLPRRPKMKVLFMSGYTSDAIVHHGVQKSELAFVSKPVVPRALLFKLRQVLDTPKLTGPKAI
ncbi:MAG TPA: ATP-binding protein [Polyangiaceae bacterium]|nr:ATP-binding protein [Polyangiaceae bacterium]